MREQRRQQAGAGVARRGVLAGVAAAVAGVLARWTATPVAAGTDSDLVLGAFNVLVSGTNNNQPALKPAAGAWSSSSYLLLLDATTITSGPSVRALGANGAHAGAGFPGPGIEANEGMAMLAIPMGAKNCWQDAALPAAQAPAGPARSPSAAATRAVGVSAGTASSRGAASLDGPAWECVAIRGPTRNRALGRSVC